MANVLDALKNMFVKLGGDKTKLNNNHDISDYINDIADVLKDDIEIASELPIVSTDDNGKVLGVVEGNWSKTDVPTELPAVTGSDNKKYLRVVSGKWQAIQNDVFPLSFIETYGSLMPSGQLAEQLDNAIQWGGIYPYVTYKKAGSADKYFFVIGRTEAGEYYFINPSDYMTIAKCSRSSQFTIL